jgi:hypothetical protein
MIKPFILLDHQVWKNLDPVSLDRIRPEYRRWFNLGNWNYHHGHLTSRVHDIGTPWPLISSHSILPIDVNENLHDGERDFARVMDSIAEEYVKETLDQGKSPCIFWSGGIDSTSIFVAFLRNNNKDFLDDLTVVCNRKSFMENPYFYDRFIRDRFRIIDTDKFDLDTENFSKIMLFDGEGGNQVFGSGGIYDLARKGRYDLLDSPYQSLDSLPYDENDRASIDIVKDSLPYCPIPIVTVYDFLWWSNFNFKFDQVLLRKILVYSHHLTPCQRGEFYKTGMRRFFAHPSMQKWSMSSLKERSQSLKKTTKHDPKKYICDFDKNPIYFLQKRETASLSDIFESRSIFGCGAIGISQDWELINLKNQQDRQMLGSMLKSWM